MRHWGPEVQVDDVILSHASQVLGVAHPGECVEQLGVARHAGVVAPGGHRADLVPKELQQGRTAQMGRLGMGMGMGMGAHACIDTRMHAKQGRLFKVCTLASTGTLLPAHLPPRHTTGGGGEVLPSALVPILHIHHNNCSMQSMQGVITTVQGSAVSSVRYTCRSHIAHICMYVYVYTYMIALSWHMRPSRWLDAKRGGGGADWNSLNKSG